MHIETLLQAKDPLVDRDHHLHIKHSVAFWPVIAYVAMLFLYVLINFICKFSVFILRVDYVTLSSG